MKTIILYATYAFLLMFVNAFNLHAKTEDNSDSCYQGECLMCYLSLSLDDAHVTKLKERYKLESSTFLGVITLKNDAEGISLDASNKRIRSIQINPNKFQGGIPYGLKATDNQQTLVAKFGADEDDLDWVYVKQLNNLISLIVNLSDPDYKGIKNLTFETVTSYVGIDASTCFNKGVNEAASDKNVKDNRDSVCLFITAMIADFNNQFLTYYEKSPEGFSDAGNYGLENGGFGWNTFRTFKGKTAAEAEINRLLEVMRLCPTPCCTYFTKEDTEKDPERPNKIKTINKTTIIVQVPKYSAKLLTLKIYLTLWHENWGIMDDYDPATVPMENDTYILQFGMEGNLK